ncbi:MAG: carboxymuconolactone decarboxylase family protein, partial [Ignavibacteriae bacterium]|nr:carboxymuconolactone decarboxylase family protein [Ignavibacteriota bacterium]
MAHIPVADNMPGIRGLMAFRPETALPLNMLAEQLLQAPSTLTKGERELIATYVSTKNQCKYCASTHGAIAKHLLGDDAELVKSVLAN